MNVHGSANFVRPRRRVYSRRVSEIIFLLIFRFLLISGFAEPPTPSEVERAHDLARFSDLRCGSCHKPTDVQALWLKDNAAPRLDGLGGRVNPDWTQRYLASPSTVFPGTTLPDLLHGLESARREADAAALTHYLYATNRSTWAPVAPDHAAVKRGERLYQSIGCMACHPLNAKGREGEVAFPRLVEKWTLPGLQAFLLNPLITRPGGRMPSMGLRSDEAFDLAHYLLRETRHFSPLEVAIYRERLRSLEELDTAEPVRTLPGADFSLKVPGNDGRLEFRWSGWMPMASGGSYTFFVKAVGAARLAVDGHWIEDEEAWEKEATEASATLHLTPGEHQVQVDFVQRGQEPPSLEISWEGAGIPRQPLPVASFRADNRIGPESPAVAFEVDPALVERGRELYGSLHCGTCHERADGTFAPGLGHLSPEKGCLSSTPPVGTPNYHFPDVERNGMRRMLAWLSPTELSQPPASQRLMGGLSGFRCLVCHERDGVGGIARDRDAYFTSAGEDLGEEGRVPPRLDGIGDKLRPEWLADVLDGSARVRPYLRTRMPHFGTDQVGFIAALLIELDRHPGAMPAVNDSLDAQRDAGRRLVGVDGLSCIACHRFNRQPAHALQVLDLTTTGKRLNPDWFHRFLKDPNRYNPGTRMPAFWPDGVSPLKEVLAGDTDRQMTAIWGYLNDGEQAKFPEGLSRQGVELVVGGEAVVYRGKLWEAGFRAITVGFPGGINLAFDAEELRLSLLWRGRFLNAGPHWTVQGMGQIHPLGSDVIVFPKGSAWAVLPDLNSAWPTNAPRELGIRMAGYQLDAARQPTFQYRWGGLEVADALNGFEVEGQKGLRRHLRLSGAIPVGLCLRLAQGNLEALGENRWRLNQMLTIQTEGHISPVVRGRGAQQQLLLPISGSGEWKVNYVW